MNEEFEKIRAGLDNLESSTLKDALCLALLKKTNLEETSFRRGRFDEMDEIANFAELVSFLKRNFSFSELSFFSIDGDHVFVEAGNRKVELHRDPITPRTPPNPLLSKPKLDPLPMAKPERFRNLELDE